MAALTFLEARLDPMITQGAQGGPCVVGRTKRYGPSGFLTQNFVASQLGHRYDISHGVRNRADAQTVVDAFYVLMATPYSGLRLKDWRDFQGTRLNTTLTNITGSTWQLQRAHRFGSVTIKRDIFKPVTGTVFVFDAGGSPLTNSIDYTTGIATVTGTPATWTGEFDVPVTFTDDEWMTDLEIATNSEAWETIQSIKLEDIGRASL